MAILSSLHPAGRIVGGLFFSVVVVVIGFLRGVAEFSGQIKGCSVCNQLGVMTKGPCNKGLPCNLIGPENGRSVHVNELRSQLNHRGGGNNAQT